MFRMIILTFICASVLNNQYKEYNPHVKRFKKDNDLISVYHDHNYISNLKEKDVFIEEKIETTLDDKNEENSGESCFCWEELDLKNLLSDDELNYGGFSDLANYIEDFFNNETLFECNKADLFSEENTVKCNNSNSNELQENNFPSTSGNLTLNYDNYDNNETSKDGFVILNDQENKIIDIDQNIKTNTALLVVKNDDLSTNEKEKIIKDVYNDILQYLMDRIYKTYHKKYLARLEGIKQAFETLDKFELDFKEYDKMYFFSDIEYLNKFEHLSLGKSETFDQTTRHDFFYNLETNISKTQKSLRREFFIVAGEKKLLYFIHEFVKLYKYIENIPEILALGCLLNTNLFPETIHFLHLINLFIEKKGIKDRSFIICLIDKAISCSPKYNLDRLSIPKLQLKSQKGSHDLGFFLWELDSNKRRNIIYEICLYMKINKVCYNNFLIEAHLKLIFLFYLYQHLIFMKYHNKSLEDMKTFKSFIDNIRGLVGCFGHYFEKYLIILKEQSEAK